MLPRGHFVALAVTAIYRSAFISMALAFLTTLLVRMPDAGHVRLSDAPGIGFEYRAANFTRYPKRAVRHATSEGLLVL